MNMKKLILFLILSILLVGCSNNNSAKGNDTGNGDEKTLVRIGLTGSDSKVWNHVKEEAAKENIDIELVFFDSYPIPNAALNSGEIEQHGYELSVIGETVYAPLGLYSKKIKNLDELKDGDKIVIPDDVTNGGRALLLLQANGLITVAPDAGNTPTIKDIENPRGFEIIELSATNIPATLEEVPLAVINSGVATDAGLTPSQDAIVLEEVKSGENSYINVIVARTEDKDNKVYKHIVELYQTEATKAVIEEDSKGSLIPVW